jgi:hypothetical protein
VSSGGKTWFLRKPRRMKAMESVGTYIYGSSGAYCEVGEGEETAGAFGPKVQTKVQMGKPNWGKDIDDCGR